MKTTRRSWIAGIASAIGCGWMFRSSDTTAKDVNVGRETVERMRKFTEALEDQEDADDCGSITTTSPGRRVMVMRRREGDAGCYPIEWDDIKAGDYIQITEWYGDLMFEQFACIARSSPKPELPGHPCKMDLIELDDFWRRPKCVFRNQNGTFFSPPDYLTTRQHGRT